MSTFTTLNLSGQRVLIKGTDSQGTQGQTVVSSEEWTEVKRHTQHSEAHEDFDRVVAEFFAPLTEAAEKLELAFNQQTRDPISYVIINEGVEPTPGQEEVVIKLSPDSVVLRLLESGDTDRLVWVGDKLEVLEVLPGSPAVTPSNEGDPHASEVEVSDEVQYPVEG